MKNLHGYLGSLFSFYLIDYLILYLNIEENFINRVFTYKIYLYSVKNDSSKNHLASLNTTITLRKYT